MKFSKAKLAATLVALVLAASACGSSETSTQTTAALGGDTIAETTAVVVEDTVARNAATDTRTADTVASGTVAGDEAADAEDAAGDESVDDETAEGAGFVTSAKTDSGDILVDSNGLAVYGYTKDTDGLPTCTGSCLGAWPAVTVDGDALPAGLDPAIFSLVDGAGGKKQLKAGDWPLYYYVSETGAGDTAGQGVGGVWYVVSPGGDLIK